MAFSKKPAVEEISVAPKKKGAMPKPGASTPAWKKIASEMSKPKC